ncbi:MAG: hypothetical protein K8R92_01000 [Planctomycetes bacterium]|nr:hypothetical protein [Planctomycetota bacterium]
MNEIDHASGTPSFKSRTSGLIFFGIVTLLLGGLCALFALMMLVAQTLVGMAGKTPPPTQPAWPVSVMYGAMAVVLIWLGIGSIRARRWARALLLILSVVWLISGIFILGGLMLVFPQFMEAMQSAGSSNQQKLPPEALLVMAVVMGAVFAVIFLILPLSYFLFYRSRHVKATCEARDPVQRWTDRCPLPVLAVSLWLGTTAPMMLLMPLAYRSVFPFFGDFLSGAAGTLAYVVMAVIFGWAARATYKLDVRAWWLVVAGSVLMAISNAITYSRHNLEDVYRLMELTPEQIEQAKQFAWFSGDSLVWSSLIFVLPLLGYMLLVKKYFRRTA